MHLLAILCTIGLLVTMNLLPMAPPQTTSERTQIEVRLVQQPKPPPTETVAIIVENAIYSSVSSSVAQFRQDLNNTGYNTILYTQVFSNHVELKGNLTSWYNTYTNFVGAVLIGRLPYAQYWHPANASYGWIAQTFICDVYLMDLDGLWWDINPTDGIYDKHNATGSADVYPEIFVGRIDPQCLTWGTVAGNINTYLGRVHSYRTGGVQRQSRALTYIDDDWVPWADGTYDNWPAWLNTPYPTRTDVHTPSTWTNATDWLTNRIIQDYQWAHLCAHSSPTTHFFGPSGIGEGTVTSAQIVATTSTINFYNLFCCSGADWSVADNLAVSYLFDGSHTVGIVGTTKTGGMLDGDYFYNPLANQNTLGESLIQWMSYVFNNPSGDAGDFWLEWYYGMNIVGDPFLTINYDCTVLTPVISSPTHPNPSLGYNNTKPQFTWTIPPDVNGIAGYYYILNNQSTTSPTPATGTYTTTNSYQTTTALANGTYYFHVVAKDNVGNIGSAAHFKVNIIVTPTTPFNLFDLLTNPLVLLLILAIIVIIILCAVLLRRRSK